MSDQLTVDKLIKFLEKVRKNHGGDTQVCHVEFGGITKSYGVKVMKIMDDLDENETIPIVLIDNR
jgi:hypothetical protein